ncbi:MAG: hybrid sensor histidine kinase/response regulator [Nitrospinota bacterium]|nr:hybrid sensor histidine kinase/response regulator [Nitrospinota bacterium]
MDLKDTPEIPNLFLEPTGPRTILVVDDDKIVAGYLVKLLEGVGYKTIVCMDGESAYQRFCKGGIDLVITDLMMPGISGLDLIAKIRLIDKEVNIVVITGFGSMEIFIDALRAGAGDFIVKPIEKDQFLKAVERVLEKKSLSESLIARTRQLINSEKMATVGVLSTGIAHEINNPTTFIRTNLQLMNEYIKRLRPRLDKLDDRKNVDVTRKIILEEFPMMIGEALRGTERIEKIVSGIKHYAYTSDENIDENVDIREVIAQAVNLVRSKMRKYITIKESFLNLKEIKGQFSKLEQVFVNLLINAADSIEEKVLRHRKEGKDFIAGEIDVSATIFEGDETSEGRTPDNLVLTFYDNGEGIPKDKINRVFDPFFTTKPIGKGTGLGLYLCYEIISQHGGAITVQSSRGEGTAFIIRLPVEGAERHPAKGD